MRPAVVDQVFSGNLALFYGSTLKRRGPPNNAIEVNPGSDRGTPARELADYLQGFLNEPTFFHGSLVAETSTRAGARDLKHIRGRFPNDLLEDLQEQAEERMLGFLQAWKRMAWLTSRPQLLDALWWKVKLDLATEVLLTLALCDGWSLQEINVLTWRDLDLQKGIARRGRRSRQILPHTVALLVALNQQSGGDRPWGSMSLEDLIEVLELGWTKLVAAANQRKGRRSPFLPWDVVLKNITE